MELPHRLYKFGRTALPDIAARFEEELHQAQRWRSIPLSRDYVIRPLWSRWVTLDESIEAEEWFAKNYPKEFHCSIQYNGIKECRNWTTDQSYAFQSIIDKRFPNRASQMPTYPHKDYRKIYYIMLTKKVEGEVS